MENEKLDGLLEGLPTEVVNATPYKKEAPKKKAPKKSDDQPETRGRKVGTTLDAPVVSYTGPLQVFTLNEFKFPEGYSPTILAFKEFLEQLGREGVTFEHLFAEAEKAYESGVSEAEVSKIKQKFAAINGKNTLTLKTMELIVGLLGYKVAISFERESVHTMNLTSNIQSLEE